MVLSLKGWDTLTNMELTELIRMEENTLCTLPYEPQYRQRREELTQQVNIHRSMLCNQISTGY